MSRRRSSGTALDRLLAQIVSPDVPADLAPRIVAETACLPQHQPREAIIAAMPPPHRTLGRHAVGQRVAGLAAFAAVACLVMLLLPVGVREQADQRIAMHNPVVATLPKRERLEQSAQVAALSEGDMSRPMPARTSKVLTSLSETEESPKLAEADPAVPSVKTEGDGARAVETTPPAAPQVAEVEGPKISVQGPPVPIELAPAGSRAKGGLGVLAGSSSMSTLPHPR